MPAAAYFFGREMQFHREAGIPVWEVLRLATSKAADTMEMGDHIGRIEIGYEADLVILDADPLADIRAVDRYMAYSTMASFSYPKT